MLVFRGIVMRNAYVLLIVQALLTMLLFFSQGYVKYVTIGLFLLLDLILFISLLPKRWSYEEVLSLAAIFSSGLFLLFYIFSRSTITDMFGVAVALLFLVVAMLQFMSRLDAKNSYDDSSRSERIQIPPEPAYYYDIEYDKGYDKDYSTSYDKDYSFKSTTKSDDYNAPASKISSSDSSLRIVESQVLASEARARESKSQAMPQGMSQVKITESKVPEPVMHIRRDSGKEKLAARAVMYELEKEARQLKNAQSMMDDIEVYDTRKKVRDVEQELVMESMDLEDVQRRIDALKAASRKPISAKPASIKPSSMKPESRKVEQAKDSRKELDRMGLEKEVSQLRKAQKQIDDINKIKHTQELEKQAKALRDAQAQIRKLQIKQNDKAISKANKQISILKGFDDAQELELEARTLKKVQKEFDDRDKLKKARELATQVKSLNNVQKQINDRDKLKKARELATQADSLRKVQKQFDERNKLKNARELVNQAKSLKNAEKQVQEIKFLDRQEKIVKQAKDIAKAQKKIDEMTKNTKKSLEKQMSKAPKLASVPKPIPLQEVKLRTLKVADETFYFSADGGNKFHKPGCLAIKKVPKNKLTLYTNKKDALKKGLQPCNVCIPK